MKKVCVLVFIRFVICSSKRPNILLFVGDDMGEQAISNAKSYLAMLYTFLLLGWADVGWNNRDAQAATPHMEKLISKGMRLHQFYAHPVCSPSRASLMTGYYSTHTKVKTPLFGVLPVGLELKFKILPEYLKELDYKNYIVGK